MAGVVEFVWVSSEQDAWVPAQVLSKDNMGLIVRVLGGTEFHLQGKIEDFDRVIPGTLQNIVDNVADLDGACEGVVLHQIRAKFQQGGIYTFVGPVLLAVNPCKDIDVYSVAFIDLFKRSTGQTNSRPHIFAIANRAYQSMILDKERQSIILCGESGSGKTENLKRCLQYLTIVGGVPPPSAPPGGGARPPATIEQKIMYTIPLLEAIGNAKTLRNQNSSRFIKSMNLYFERATLKLKSASLSCLLQDRTRVISQAQGERNFHIFYMLLTGADNAMKNQLHLSQPLDFSYIAQSGCLVIDRRDDRIEFRKMMAAMIELGFDFDFQRQFLCILAGIMHLGNIMFQPTGSGSDDDDGSAVANRDVAAIIANLWMVDAAALQQALCTRKASEDPSSSRPIDVHRAVEQKDAIAKDVYARLFSHLINKICLALAVPATDKEFCVSMLETMGFESFKVNCFEQLCVNYADEKLQTLYTMIIFRRELETIRSEGLPVDDIPFQDNRLCVDLIDRPGFGLFAKLDEETAVARASDAKFCAKLHQIFEENTATKNEAYVRNRRRPNDFGVKHFGADVAYTTDGFMERNKELLSVQVYELMLSSRCKTMSDMYASCAVEVVSQEEARKHRRFVGTKFAEEFTALLGGLADAKTQFVRCIRPNQVMGPDIFEGPYCLKQIKSAGTFEILKMKKTGFAVIFSFKDFVKRYKIFKESFNLLASKSNPDLSMISRGIVNHIVDKFKIDPREIICGASKIFFRNASTKSFLDQQRGTSVICFVCRVQAFFRGNLARKALLNERTDIKKRKGEERAREAQERETMASEESLVMVIVEKEREAERQRLSELERLEKAKLAREEYDRKRKLSASMLIQALFRGMHARKWYRALKVMVALEEAMVYKDESRLIKAIQRARNTVNTPEVHSLMRSAMEILRDIQEESRIRQELTTALRMEDEQHLEIALKAAEEAGLVHFEEFSGGTSLLQLLRHRSGVRKHINALAAKENIAEFLDCADELNEAMLEAERIGVAPGVLDKARRRLQRCEQLLRVRNALREAVEEASKSRMRKALEERQHYVVVHGNAFCLQEALACQNIMRMFHFEHQLKNCTAAVVDQNSRDAVVDDKRSDGDSSSLGEIGQKMAAAEALAATRSKMQRKTTTTKGLEVNAGDSAMAMTSYNSEVYSELHKMDPRLPRYIRTLYDDLYSAMSEGELYDTRARLKQVVPDASVRIAYLRVYKWCLSYCKWLKPAKGILANPEGIGSDTDSMMSGSSTTRRRPAAASGEKADESNGLGKITATTLRRMRQKGGRLELQMAELSGPSSTIQLGGGKQPTRRLSPTYRAPTKAFMSSAKYIPPSRSFERMERLREEERENSRRGKGIQIEANYKQDMPRSDKVIQDTLNEYTEFYNEHRPKLDWRL